ncbi:MAG: Ig-like domain repeat protein [Acidobacteria bacterium Pan2503]|uniref:Ig-like domain repeat protein n=1 Tax=Candidatus Acidiferrum panamense TaxID=2741543 RepID=A0A7V8SZ85_9BACT|nr:Ig-like domain repeat protein [Candidatus Acidoferrum panamensis]
MLLVLLLLGLKRVPRPYRRAYVCASLLLLAGLVAGLAAGCGGGYGGGGGGGPHYDSITAVYGGDATYAGSTSPAITITVQ